MINIIKITFCLSPSAGCSTAEWKSSAPSPTAMDPTSRTFLSSSAHQNHIILCHSISTNNSGIFHLSTLSSL